MTWGTCGRSWLVLVGATIALGCSSEGPDPLAEACGGERPALEACTRGAFHADCGGSEEPVLACHETGGDCRWFEGGCVAIGFLPVACPADMLCCETTPDGTWPYPDALAPSPGFVQDLIHDLRAIGGRVITSEAPADVAVVVDPGVSVAEPAITCSGEDAMALDLCHQRLITPGVRAMSASRLLLLRPDALFGDWIYLELFPGPSPFGRAFVRFHNDYTPDYPLTCETLLPVVHLSGTATLSSLEEGEVHGRVALTLETGGTIDAVF